MFIFLIHLSIHLNYINFFHCLYMIVLLNIVFGDSLSVDNQLVLVFIAALYQMLFSTYNASAYNNSLLVTSIFFSELILKYLMNINNYYPWKHIRLLLLMINIIGIWLLQTHWKLRSVSIKTRGTKLVKVRIKFINKVFFWHILYHSV